MTCDGFGKSRCVVLYLNSFILSMYSNQIAKWMRPDVKAKKNDQVRSIVFVLPKALACIENAGLSVPSDNNVRDLINKVHGATTDYRSIFLDQPRKICCVRVPRHILSPELLEQIDECMYKL